MGHNTDYFDGMPTHRSRLFALPLTLLLALTSCVTFEAGETPGADQWPPAMSKAKELQVTTSGLPPKFAPSWERGVARELAQSGRFKGVDMTNAADARRTPADVSLALEFTHARQDLWTTRIWMGVCAISATVIPARTVQYFDVHAVLRDGKGKELGTIERSVHASTWVGILTLFVLPFEGAGHSEMIRDTTRSIIIEAVDKGWL